MIGARSTQCTKGKSASKRPFNKELIDYDRFEYILAVLIDGAPYERRVYTNRPLSDGYE